MKDEKEIFKSLEKYGLLVDKEKRQITLGENHQLLGVIMTDSVWIKILPKENK